MNNNIIVVKVRDNEVLTFDPLFKNPERKVLRPKLNWLCSMNILNDISEINKKYDLVGYLKSIREKYINDSFTLSQIDFVINF